MKHIPRLYVLIAFCVLAAGARGETAAEALRQAGIRSGLIVHVGCGESPSEAAALMLTDACVVQGLDTDPTKVTAAREHLHAKELYGPVSIKAFAGNVLPYNDNLVNALLVESAGDLGPDEMLRVLVPNGVALVRNGAAWTRHVKPVPPDTDDWPHSLYDSTGNAVSMDRVVGPPRHLQWFGLPRFGRQHEHMSSISAVVSAGGRVFYIADEGSNVSLLLPSDWQLVARDAHNGVILWKRPIKEWHARHFPMKNGPSSLGHRVVATDKIVYVTLGLNAPIVALDAATGSTVREYAATADTHEFVLNDGMLYTVTSPPGGKILEYERELTDPVPERNRIFKIGYDKGPRTIKAVRADTGKRLWQRDTPVQTLSMSVDGKHVVYHNDERIVCLNKATGAERWASEPIHPERVYAFGRSATLVLYEDVVLFSGQTGDVTAWSIDDGRQLWKAPQPGTGHHSAQDIFVIDGKVWYGQTASGGKKGTFEGRELHSGKVLHTFDPDVQVPWFHHRCHRGRATVNYLLVSRTGIEYVDFRKQTWDVNHWVRGACAYGIVPANGMTYAPSHPCACYLSAKMQYFNALAPESRVTYEEAPRTAAQRLVKGPAYAETLARRPGFHMPHAADWPQYRCDITRSGATPEPVAPRVKPLWRTAVGGRLSRIVVAEGKVFVSAVDRHTLYALDAVTGKECWHFTAGGRIDSPPSVVGRQLLFGCADGSVYCLTTSEGSLVWRYDAAPQHRQMMALGQLESAWPVHGSVLVRDGEAYCTAGRNRFLDGGIRLVVLNVETGALVSETVLGANDDKTRGNLHTLAKGLSMPVALSDILSVNEKYLFMHEQVFDLKGKPLRDGLQDDEIRHLFTPTGFLDDSWFHRTYWLYGSGFTSGWNQWYNQGRVLPAGRLLVHAGDRVYGFGRKQGYYRWSTPLEYHLFCIDKNPSLKPLAEPKPTPGKKKKSGRRSASYCASTDWLEYHWEQAVPLVVKAMVLAGETLFIAGPPDVLDEEDGWLHIEDKAYGAKFQAQLDALDGKQGSRLWAVSAGDGKKLSEIRLESAPVYDGMAAARGRLYMAMDDGAILCFGAE